MTRSLYLATDGDVVTILRGSRRMADIYASRNRLTVLTSDAGELERLVARGAIVTDARDPQHDYYPDFLAAG